MSSLPHLNLPYAASVLAELDRRPPAPELNGELSPEEIAFIPEVKARPWKPAGLPVAEIDCDLRIPGQGEVAVTLAVWGKFIKARKGGHEPGERPYEPDDHAGFEVEAVLWGDADVTAELGQPGEEALAAHVMENCEPDTPPEPERGHFCEDRR